VRAEYMVEDVEAEVDASDNAMHQLVLMNFSLIE
jgi:hypothetical protein